jgi:hypothetical protein
VRPHFLTSSWSNHQNSFFMYSSTSEGGNGDYLLRRVEAMDISTYPALQAAFSILLAAYRSQYESLETLRHRWSQERQVGKNRILKSHRFHDALCRLSNQVSWIFWRHFKQFETLWRQRSIYSCPKSIETKRTDSTLAYIDHLTLQH